MRTLTGLMLASVLSLSPARAFPKVAEVGRPAPAFTLKDSAGKPVSLKDFKGKVVVIEWMNPTCPFCVRHLERKTSAGIADAYKDRGVVVLGINSTVTQGAAECAKMAANYALPFPVLVDNASKVAKLYGAKTTPHMFIIDAKGVLAYRGAIDSDREGDQPAPKNYVRQALDELLAGKPVSEPDTQPYGCGVKYKK